jgi:hypothetical protein
MALLSLQQVQEDKEQAAMAEMAVAVVHLTIMAAVVLRE